jgi:hypothetical protein
VRPDPAIRVLERYLARLESRGDFARALQIAVRWYCGA